MTKEIYVPLEGEILHLTDGTPIKVKEVHSDYFTAFRLDGQNFTNEQTGYAWMVACWQFNGKRGEHSKSNAKGMQAVLPNPKLNLEREVAALGGTITWTDPDLLRAREIWAKHARPIGGPQVQRILDGLFDDGAAIKAILEAIKSN